MRNIAEIQTELLNPGIESIKIDIYCRDELPSLLLGLQELHRHPAILTKILNFIASLLPEKVSLNRGRPGLDLWQIMVLGYIRLSCNIDFDKLSDLATNHHTIRLFLHYNKSSDARYPRQTLVDNISLFTQEALEMINKEINDLGHVLVGAEGPKECRIDSFVVETDVHFPTDLSLMWDGIRTLIRLCRNASIDYSIAGWRESKSMFRKNHKLYRECQLVRKGNPQKDAAKERKKAEEFRTVTAYSDSANSILEKAKGMIVELRKHPFTGQRISKIESFISKTELQIDLLNRRIVNDEKIPNSDKIHSLFQPHTEWISKGKAGKPQELGVRVAIAEDEYGFILGWRVMFGETDDKVTVKMAQELKKKYPSINMFSFDKGFYTPENKREVELLVDNPIVPKKGKLNAKEKMQTSTPEYIKYRHKHSRIESAIHSIENHGLDRCLDHGVDGFERYVGLAVVARNVLQIGKIKQQRLIEEARQAKLQIA